MIRVVQVLRRTKFTKFLAGIYHKIYICRLLQYVAPSGRLLKRAPTDWRGTQLLAASGRKRTQAGAHTRSPQKQKKTLYYGGHTSWARKKMKMPPLSGWQPCNATKRGCTAVGEATRERDAQWAAGLAAARFAVSMRQRGLSPRHKYIFFKSKI